MRDLEPSQVDNDAVVLADEGRPDAAGDAKLHVGDRSVGEQGVGPRRVSRAEELPARLELAARRTVGRVADRRLQGAAAGGPARPAVPVAAVGEAAATRSAGAHVLRI